MQIYLIRHAQSEDNVVEVDLSRRMTRAEFNAFLRHAPESRLTALGEEQARRLTQRLAQVPITQLYTSPLPRALATAQVLAAGRGIAPHIITELRELEPPPLKEYGGSVSLRWLFLQAFMRMLLSPASEDRVGIALRRARAVWRQITAEPAEAIAVVSHGWFIGTLLLSLRFDRHWRVVTRDLANGGISLVVSRVPTPARSGVRVGSTSDPLASI